MQGYFYYQRARTPRRGHNNWQPVHTSDPPIFHKGDPTHTGVFKLGPEHSDWTFEDLVTAYPPPPEPA